VAKINMSALPVVVLSCKVFQGMFEKNIPDDLRITIDFLEYGLHAVPKNLNRAVQEAIDKIEQPSLILLGYGLCGNGLHNIRSGKHTLVIPKADDCIAILMGSREKHLQMFSENPGTYYLTKGWLEAGSDPLGEYERALAKYGKETADWVMTQQYRHYKRLIFIAHKQEDLDKYRPRALQVAEYCQQWGMEYQEMLGSENLLRQLAEIAAAPDQISDQFLVIPPGETLTQEQFR